MLAIHVTSFQIDILQLDLEETPSGLEHPTGILGMGSSNYYDGTDPLTHNIEHNCFTPSAISSYDTAGMGALPKRGPYESI